MSRVLPRVLAVLALALTLGPGAAHAAPADTPTPPPALVVDSWGPTQGTPVPGSFLTADRGSWQLPGPESYTFQWLRDGVPIPGATLEDYTLQTVDVGHQLSPQVTGNRPGYTSTTFPGTAVAVRKISSTLTLDVRRVHPPGKHRLVWTAITFMSTERPWSTDGGTVTAFKEKDGRLKELGRAAVARGAAFVQLPWKRAPIGKTRVLVCFAGNEAVETSCSPFDVVRRSRSRSH